MTPGGMALAASVPASKPTTFEERTEGRATAALEENQQIWNRARETF